MQAKKRAKSVKFGSKELKPKTAKIEASEFIDDKKGELIIEDITIESVVEPIADKAEVSNHTQETPKEETEPETHQASEQVAEAKEDISVPTGDTEESQINEVEEVTSTIQEAGAGVQEQNTADEVPAEAQDGETTDANEQETGKIEEASISGEDGYLVEKEVKKNMLGFFVLIAVIAFIVGIICMAGQGLFLRYCLYKFEILYSR